jgi:hypothetical protein
LAGATAICAGHLPARALLSVWSVVWAHTRQIEVGPCPRSRRAAGGNSPLLACSLRLKSYAVLSVSIFLLDTWFFTNVCRIYNVHIHNNYVLKKKLDGAASHHHKAKREGVHYVQPWTGGTVTSVGRNGIRRQAYPSLSMDYQRVVPPFLCPALPQSRDEESKGQAPSAAVQSPRDTIINRPTTPTPAQHQGHRCPGQ